MQGYYLQPLESLWPNGHQRVLCGGFEGIREGIFPQKARAPAPGHIPILITSYFTEMSTRSVPRPPSNSDLVPCNFWSFPKQKENFRYSHFEGVEKMKQALARVLDTFALEL